MSFCPLTPVNPGRRIRRKWRTAIEEVDGGKEVFERLFGKPGEPVPAVDFADMKAMKAVMEDVKKEHPKGGVAIGMEVWQSVCSPDADIRAVSYRLRLLGMLEISLQPVYSGGQWSEAALKAAAKM